jgi:hypothetical protein
VDYNATDIESDPLQWNLTTNASWLSINSTYGYLNGTPLNSHVGWYWVNVTVWDGKDEDWSNFTLTVNNVNDPPTIDTSDDLSADEDAFYSVDYEATDIDPTSDTLGWTLKTNASFLSIVSDTGVLSDTPGNNHVGTYWVNVTVSDGKGGKDFTNFTLTVYNVNDDPSIGTTDDTTAVEDQFYSVDYNANDIDPTMDILTWSLNTNASWLSINSTTGWLNGTPTNDDVGWYWVNVTVSDGVGGLDWHNFTVTVSNTNDPPSITTSDDESATEDVQYYVDYEADDDDGDTLTWSLETNASAWLTINPNTGVLQGTPTNAHVGWYWVNVTVDDGNGGTDFHNFTITVSNVNDPPEITSSNDNSATEDQLYSKDYNADDDEGDTLTWSLNTNATWLAINSSTGVLNGTPDNDDVGWYWVNVTVDDGNGGLDWANFTLTVYNTNDAPNITTSDDESATEDVYYSVDYEADDDDGDTLTWYLDTNATWLSIASDTGVLNGTPENDDVGTFWVNVSVSDGKGGDDFHNFTVSVSNVNDPPEITTSDETSATEDVLYSIDYNATEVDVGDTLTWYRATNASWLSIDSVTGWLNGTPTNSDVGWYWVNVSVDDGSGGDDWTNFTVTVSNVNDPPSIDTGDDNSADEDVLYSQNYDGSDIDPTSDTLTWSLKTNTTTWLTIDSVTGWLNGTPGNSEVGSYWVNVTLSDGKGGKDWHNFTLFVYNANDPPTIDNSDDNTATEDVLYAVDYNATDIDPSLDTLTWDVETNATAWLSIDSATGWLNGTPTNSDVGWYWVNVSVDDGNGGTAWTNFTVTVSNVNDPPTIDTSDDDSATEDVPYSTDYDATDIDPTNDDLSWSLVTNASWLSIDGLTGVLSGTPDNDDVGSFWVNVTVSDGNGGTDFTNFTVNVTNVNDDPGITTGDITSATEDVYYENDYNATDVDPTEDTLTWTLNTNASWLSIGPTNGTIYGKPLPAHVGWYWVNVTVSDGKGGLDWSNFTLTVYGFGVNTPPSITTTDDESANEDEFYSVDYNATDGQGDPLNWNLTTNASWLSINSTYGWLNGTPTNADVGWLQHQRSSGHIHKRHHIRYRGCAVLRRLCRHRPGSHG